MAIARWAEIKEGLLVSVLPQPNGMPVGADAKAFSHEVRSHWGVENGCYWTLD